MEHVRWLAEPNLRNPTIVYAFTGWNDAGDAASSAVRALVERWGATAVAEIDPEPFTDFATIRPHVRINDGPPLDRLADGRRCGRRRFPAATSCSCSAPSRRCAGSCSAPSSSASPSELGARMSVSLGALLADVPHTRPVQIIGTASDPELIDRFELQRSRYEGPTGIVGVLHDAMATAGIPAASLWAAVPQYAAQVPSPKAALALVERACGLIGSPAPVDAFASAAAEYDARIAALIADDDDLVDYVSRLESFVDDELDDDDDDDDDDAAGGRARRREPRRARRRGRAVPPRPRPGDLTLLERFRRPSVAAKIVIEALRVARSGSGRRRRRSGTPRRRSRRRPSAPTTAAPAVVAGQGVVGRTSRRRRTPAGGSCSSPPVAWQWNTQHVHAEPGEAHPLAVDDGEHPLRLALDAGLLDDLLDGHLGRRVADVGPAGRVQPDPGVGALDEQQLAVVVADDRADGDLRRDVAGHADADRLQPLLHEVVLLALDLQRLGGVDARRPAPSFAAALMSAATWSTSSKRSRS